MNKKQIILKLFDEAEWLPGYGGGRVKIITYENFRDAGLSPTIEYQQRYSDVQYARSIFNKLGYKVLIGLCFNIIERKQLTAPLKKG